MPLTYKQRKAAWIIGVVLVLVHFAPNIIASLQRAWHSAPVGSSKPSPEHVAPVQDPAALRAAEEQAKLATLTGLWTGTAVRADRGSCALRLEVKPMSQKPGTYLGYSTMSCGPSLAFLGVPTPHNQVRSFLNEAMPVSTILSGPAVGGAIELTLEQTVSATLDGCLMSTLSLRPFGDNNLAATWKESGKCEGGQMVMRRLTR